MRTRELGAATVGSHHPDLAELDQLVAVAKLREGVCRLYSMREELESTPAVAPVCERLRRYGANTRPRPGNRGAGIEGLRLHRDADFTGVGIAANQRVRHVCIGLRAQT